MFRSGRLGALRRCDAAVLHEGEAASHGYSVQTQLSGDRDR